MRNRCKLRGAIGIRPPFLASASCCYASKCSSSCNEPHFQPIIACLPYFMLFHAFQLRPVDRFDPFHESIFQPFSGRVKIYGGEREVIIILSSFCFVQEGINVSRY